MNCTCIQRVELETLALFYKNKKVKSSSLQLMFVGVKMEAFTCSTMTVELEGQKRKEHVEIKHRFCPFCGKSTEELTAENAEKQPAESAKEEKV